MVVKTLKVGPECPEYTEKSLEVRSPLMQDGPDELRPNRGGSTLESAEISRLCRLNARDRAGRIEQ
jgi:hypothetical protein